MTKKNLLETINELITDTNNDLPIGKVMSLGDIPSVITEQHHENYYFWQNLGLKDALLLHIDAHDDLADYVMPIDSNNQENYYKKLEINSFICAAKHYGIIGNPSYWLNPYKSDKNRLKSLELETEIRKAGPYEKIRWTKSYKHQISNEKGVEEINNSKRPLILDIDLDGFSCCGRNEVGHPYNSYDYEKRIEETIAWLSKLNRPDLITITRSQSCFGVGGETYVDPKLVNDVEDKTIKGLIKLYGEKILLYQNKTNTKNH